MRFRGWAKLHGGDEMIFQPAAQSEESKIVPLLHADAQIAEEPQCALGILAVTEMPAKVEQQIRFLARNSSFLAEQFIDHLQRTTLAAI